VFKKKDIISIRNAVIATLIATAIIAFVPLFRRIAATFIKTFWIFFLYIGSHLVSEISLPFWLFYILCILAFILITSIVVVVYPNKKNNIIQFSEYTDDMLFGIKWSWLY